MRTFASLIAVASLAVSILDVAPRAVEAQANLAAPPLPSVFVYHGRRYCFATDGWEGPGWYWCGYAHRPGLGFGGPPGWLGWRLSGGWHRGWHRGWHGGAGPWRHHGWPNAFPHPHGGHRAHHGYRHGNGHPHHGGHHGHHHHGHHHGGHRHGGHRH